MKPVSGLLALGLMAGLAAAPSASAQSAPRPAVNSASNSAAPAGAEQSLGLASRLRAAALAQGKSL